MIFSGFKIAFLTIAAFIAGSFFALQLASISSNEQIEASIANIILKISEDGKGSIRKENRDDGVLKMECALLVADEENAAMKNRQFSSTFPLEYIAIKAIQDKKEDDRLLATKGLVHGTLAGIYKKNGNAAAHESHLNEAQRILKVSEREVGRLSEIFIKDN